MSEEYKKQYQELFKELQATPIFDKDSYLVALSFYINHREILQQGDIEHLKELLRTRLMIVYETAKAIIDGYQPKGE